MRLRRRTRLTVLLAVGAVTLGLLLAAACGSAEVGEEAGTAPVAAATDTPAPASPSLTATVPEPTAPPATQAPSGQEPEKTPVVPTAQMADDTPPQESDRMVALAVADLAQQLGNSPQEITVVSVEAVEWSDSSLGCPQPGRRYLQVVTPGYLVVLVAEGQSYEAHTDRQGNVVLCEEESMAVVPPPRGTIEPGMEALVALVVEDLAGRLQLPAEQIEVLEVRSVVWPDASLGCPLPGMRYKQVPMDGALILLVAAGTTYEYHNGGDRDPFLCEQPLQLDKGALPKIDLTQPAPPDPDE